MLSIRQLQDAADHSRNKAELLRQDARRAIQKAGSLAEDPRAAVQFAVEAQKYEVRAAVHDREALKHESEAADLELRVIELNRQKNEVQSVMQAQIDKLDKEEKYLRG